MLVIAVLIHLVCALVPTAELNTIVLFDNTVNTEVVDIRGLVSGEAQPVTVPEINTR